MSGDYETVTVMTLIRADAIKEIHRLFLEALCYSTNDRFRATGPDVSYILGIDPMPTIDPRNTYLDSLRAEMADHPFFQLAKAGDHELSLEDILQDILKGLDYEHYPHIDVMASQAGGEPRPGAHGGWAMRVYRDNVKKQTTQGMFNVWDAEPNPKVAAVVNRITDYMTNQPALQEEDRAPVMTLPPLQELANALHQPTRALQQHGVETMTVLVASTDHLSQDEVVQLNNNLGCPGENLDVSLQGEYGWVFHISYPLNITEGLSEGFAGAINYARSLGFNWLRLDADGASLPGVITYEW